MKYTELCLYFHFTSFLFCYSFNGLFFHSLQLYGLKNVCLSPRSPKNHLSIIFVLNYSFTDIKRTYPFYTINEINAKVYMQFFVFEFSFLRSVIHRANCATCVYVSNILSFLFVCVFCVYVY